MALARGRQEVFGSRNFDVEYVSDQVATDYGSKIWVSDDILATQSARRQQTLQGGVHEPREKTSERRMGVNGAAGAAAGGCEPPELEAGRSPARQAGARRAAHGRAGRHGSAAGLPAANSSRGTQVCGLEGRRYITRTGPGSRLGSCTASTRARHLHVPIGSHLYGKSTE